MPARRKPQAADLAAFAREPNAHTTEAERPVARRPFNSYAKVENIDGVQQLARRLSYERNARVSVASLIDEALADLLTKYQGR